MDVFPHPSLMFQIFSALSTGKCVFQKMYFVLTFWNHYYSCIYIECALLLKGKVKYSKYTEHSIFYWHMLCNWADIFSVPSKELITDLTSKLSNQMNYSSQPALRSTPEEKNSVTVILLHPSSPKIGTWSAVRTSTDYRHCLPRLTNLEGRGFSPRPPHTPLQDTAR